MLLWVTFIIWCVVTGWVAVDAARHGRSWFSWALLAFITGVVGLTVWAVVRRRLPPIEPAPGRARTALLWLGGVPAGIATLIFYSWLTTFVGQVGRVEGHAMSPTLVDRDLVFVNKLAYRMDDPTRGDVVMLYYPVNPDKAFVMRVIAAEGDMVRIRDGLVFLNDIPLADPYVADDGRSHEDWGPQVVPEGYDFVLGDRRNKSADSRHWGMVPKKYVIGRVAYRLWGARMFTMVR